MYFVDIAKIEVGKVSCFYFHCGAYGSHLLIRQPYKYGNFNVVYRKMRSGLIAL